MIPSSICRLNRWVNSLHWCKHSWNITNKLFRSCSKSQSDWKKGIYSSQHCTFSFLLIKWCIQVEIIEYVWRNLSAKIPVDPSLWIICFDFILFLFYFVSLAQVCVCVCIWYFSCPMSTIRILSILMWFLLICVDTERYYICHILVSLAKSYPH